LSHLDFFEGRSETLPFSNLCLPALLLLTEWPEHKAINVGWGREDDGSASRVDADGRLDADGASRLDNDGGASRIDNDGKGMDNADVGIKGDDDGEIDATCGTKDSDTGPKDGKVGAIEGPGVTIFTFVSTLHLLFHYLHSPLPNFLDLRT
jgi:hypothetical protein